MEEHEKSLAKLAATCSEEMRKYLEGQPSREGACFEIFRRAIMERNERAWEIIIGQYRGLVIRWAHRYMFGQSIDDNVDQDNEYWVNRTFERFWAAVNPERFASFHDFSSILHYLQVCARSVVVDDWRTRSRYKWLDVSDPVAEAIATPDLADGVISELARTELWEVIKSEAENDAEQGVLYYYFLLGMAPRELLQVRPNVYSSSRQIYQIIDRLRYRLSHNPKIRELLSPRNSEKLLDQRSL